MFVSRCCVRYHSIRPGRRKTIKDMRSKLVKNVFRGGIFYEERISCGAWHC